MKTVAFRVFNASHFRKKDFVVGSSPFNLYKFDKAERDTDLLYRKVLNVSKTGSPYKTFGLTFKDLFELDYCTFCDIKESVEEIERVRASKTAEITKNMLEE